MLAYKLLLEKGKRGFWPGTAMRTVLGEPCGPHDDPQFFDCLGAIFWAYRNVAPEDRHPAAKRAFGLCRARYDHTRLGKLDYDESLELLQDAQV
jgi:hypothetical protein